MAHGLPVITTAVGAVDELPAEAAVRLPADAGPEQVGDALAHLLADPDRRRALAAAGRAYRVTRQPADAARSLVAAATRRPGSRRPDRGASRPGQAPWHFLNFLPEPHQHGSLRPS